MYLALALPSPVAGFRVQMIDSGKGPRYALTDPRGSHGSSQRKLCAVVTPRGKMFSRARTGGINRHVRLKSVRTAARRSLRVAVALHVDIGARFKTARFEITVVAPFGAQQMPTRLAKSQWFPRGATPIVCGLRRCRTCCGSEFRTAPQTAFCIAGRWKNGPSRVTGDACLLALLS